MAKMDRKLLSKEDHEIAYVRHLARTSVRDNKGRKETDQCIGVTVSELRRLSKAVLKFTHYQAKNMPKPKKKGFWSKMLGDDEPKKE